MDDKTKRALKLISRWLLLNYFYFQSLKEAGQVFYLLLFGFCFLLYFYPLSWLFTCYWTVLTKFGI